MRDRSMCLSGHVNVAGNGEGDERFADWECVPFAPGLAAAIL
jgi:hypothetical protein